MRICKSFQLALAVGVELLTLLQTEVTCQLGLSHCNVVADRDNSVVLQQGGEIIVKTHSPKAQSTPSNSFCQETHRKAIAGV